MKTTDVVAWWGAIVATAVFAWDFYKWKRAGARIRFEARPNFVVSGVRGADSKASNIMFTATNIGTLPTTLEILGFDFYKTWLQRIRLPEQTLIITPHTTQALPYMLHPGTNWVGWIAQDQDFENMIRNGHLIALLRHSGSARPLRYRVEFRKKRN